MANVRISFDLDRVDPSSFTWGDMEDLQGGKFSAIRGMIEKYAVVEGLPQGDNLSEFLRGLSIPEMNELVGELTSIMQNKINPVDENGKNSNGGSRSSLARGPARRR